jgi:carbamoylphosphate synthase small subunit
MWGVFGAEGEALGEVVFNTSMTGYQEILTDPSYEGQLVAMTYRRSATSASMPKTPNLASRSSKDLSSGI